MATRRYDIDWLRVIAIGLLLIYHIAIGFQPWGLMIGFIQNQDTLPKLWTPLTMLNVWRIPILFFVSGMGVSFAIRRRNWRQLIVERSRRILLPFIFGILAIVPLHVLILQRYYELPFSYEPGVGHLWFLGNIFAYVILLLPLFFYLKENENGKVHEWIKRIFSSPIGLILIVAGFVLEVVLVKPALFEMYAQTWHGFILGGIAFLFGFCGVYAGDGFWKILVKGRWMYLLLAIGLFLTRLYYFNAQAPAYLIAVESCTWIFSVFGFTSRYLNKPSQTLTYLSQGAYPIYILHMVFLYLASLWIFPAEWAAGWKLFGTMVVTFAGCLAVYEFLIRRISLVRPLFGLK